MALLRSAFLALLLVGGILASPVRQSADSNEHGPTTRELEGLPNGNGTHDGYYYFWWSDGASAQRYTNGPKGAYSVTWTSPGNFVGGKGWKDGYRRNITYSADWKPVDNGNSYLMIYGWAKNPQVEYYIIESHGAYNPGTHAEAKGSVEVNGGTYKLYRSIRYGLPSVPGTPTIHYFWAIREQQRTSGTVDTGKIFDAWAAANMTIGDHEWQIVGTEGYYSAGASKVTVKTAP